MAFSIRLNKVQVTTDFILLNKLTAKRHYHVNYLSYKIIRKVFLSSKSLWINIIKRERIDRQGLPAIDTGTFFRYENSIGHYILTKWVQSQSSKFEMLHTERNTNDCNAQE